MFTLMADILLRWSFTAQGYGYVEPEMLHDSQADG